MQIEEDTVGDITSDTQQMDTNINRIAVNNEQNEDPNYMTVKSSGEEPNENNTTCKRYGRIVKRKYRLKLLINKLLIHIHSIYL